MADEARKVVASNRKAHHEYFLEEQFEAGIVLQGTEIKSLRAGQVQLRDSYVLIEEFELFLRNCHIAPYGHARENHDPVRPRKLLMHKREILKIRAKVREKGYTLIPVQIYLTKGRAKVEIALAKGKKLHDKREDIAKRDAERDMRREMGRRE
jgi:SsrA-binding protein